MSKRSIWLAVLVAGIWFALCPGTSSAQENEQPWLSGVTGYESALENQKMANAPFAVFFYTNWCGYCRAFNKNILEDASVKDFLSDVWKVKVDVDQDPALAARYGFRTIPHFLIVTRSSGAQEIDTQDSPSGFIEACRNAGLK